MSNSSKKQFPDLGGFVTSAKIFLDRNFTKINPYGLLSEQIFGPIRDYKCSCGYYSLKTLNKGKKCPKCGVLCESSLLRLTTFGKIKLPLPVIKTNRKKKLKTHILRKYDNILVPIWHDANATNKCYLALDKYGKKLYITQELDDSNGFVIPLRITGIQSFVLSLEYLYQFQNKDIPIIDTLIKQIFEDDWITDVIKVIPPDLRPLLIDKNKKELLTGNINTSYTRLLEKIKRIQLFSETFYENKIIIFDMITNYIEHNKSNPDYKQEIVDPLIIEIDRLTAVLQHYVDEIYQHVTELIHGKEGLIRQELIGKTVEFTGRAVITVDPGILPYQIRVPKRILYKLWRPHFIHWLVTEKKYDFDECYNKFILMKYEDNKELFDEFLDSVLKKRTLREAA